MSEGQMDHRLSSFGQHLVRVDSTLPQFWYALVQLYCNFGALALDPIFVLGQLCCKAVLPLTTVCGLLLSQLCSLVDLSSAELDVVQVGTIWLGRSWEGG